MFDLSDVWGTSDLARVFGGGPEEGEDFSQVKDGSMNEQELEGLCF